MSLAQTDFCRKHGYDPQSPLCAHVILAGTVTKVRGDLQTGRLAAGGAVWLPARDGAAREKAK